MKVMRSDHPALVGRIHDFRPTRVRIKFDGVVQPVDLGIEIADLLDQSPIVGPQRLQ